MDAHNSSPALQWTMYAPGSIVAFCATNEETGFRVVLERDDEPVITSVADDSSTLLRMSNALRARLQDLGFAATPKSCALGILAGGPCWGPGAPLASSLIESIR